MDLDTYHWALNMGYSERESTKMGEEAWENRIIQPDPPCPEPEYEPEREGEVG